MKHYLIDLRRLVTFQIEEGRSLKETQDAVRPVLEKKFKKWKKLERLDDNIKRAYMEFSTQQKS